MNEEEFQQKVMELGKCTVAQIKELRKQIDEALVAVEGDVTPIMSKENSSALREEWHIAESIDDDNNYKKLKYRKVERIGFYIRPLRDWYFPCPKCQAELKQMMAEGTWILGNKDYEPMIELNSTKNEIDDDSWFTLEEHEATPEELKRIGKDGWVELE